MKRTLLTIVTEGVIERAVVQDLKRLGARGYTIVEARGEGARGVRAADWEHSSNIRIETVCDRGVADAILAHLAEKYYEHYAMIAYLAEVEVLRGEKF